MPYVDRPDGARIHYETYGQGYPLLCLAPGGVNSEIAFWERSAINPIREFAGEFLVVAMDQRNAGTSFAPAAPVSYDLTAGDQLAVLDHLGIEQAHTMGGCIGVMYVLRLVHDAPGRITAGVCQDAVGIDHTNSMSVFTGMFQPALALAREKGVAAVVESAMENPMFMANNAAGPFARRIHADETFRAEILAMSTAEYIALIEAYCDGVWPNNPPYFTVSEDWLRQCPAPLLVLPGSDVFHPTSIAEAICRLAPQAACFDVDCRSPEKLAATIEAVRAFLRNHRPD